MPHSHESHPPTRGSIARRVIEALTAVGDPRTSVVSIVASGVIRRAPQCSRDQRSSHTRRNARDPGKAKEKGSGTKLDPG